MNDVHSRYLCGTPGSRDGAGPPRFPRVRVEIDATRMLCEGERESGYALTRSERRHEYRFELRLRAPEMTRRSEVGYQIAATTL